MTPNPEKNKLAEEKLDFLLSLPWMKIFTWGLFLLVVYAVRSFFTVIFLTFILTYIAAHVVNRFGPRFGRWEWFRKVIVLVTFAIFFAISYAGGNFIIPHIIKQGQGVAKMVQDIGLDRGIQKVIPDLYGHWRFARYRLTRDYGTDLEEFSKKQDIRQLSRDAFLEQAKMLRNAFRAEEAARCGQERWEKARTTPEYEAAAHEWLERKTAEDLYFPADKRAKLDAAKEAALVNVMGQGAFDLLKRSYGEQYPTYLQSQIVKELVASLERDRHEAYLRSFQERYIHDEGEKAVAALEKTPQWEERFQAHYEKFRKNNAREAPYPYDQFVRLEAAPDNEKFVALLGAEQADIEGKSALEKKFEAEKRNEFSEGFNKKLSEAGIFTYVNDAAGAILARLFTWLQQGIASLISFTFDLILSVFLSFVIVWDLPRLAGGVRRLAQSRLHRLYDEIVPGLTSFGLLLGQSFVARAVIAIINTALILGALVIMGIENRTFLCTMVFICSFIPIAGVVISGVPIAIVGLQMGGPGLALQLVLALTVITIVESLLLDPKVMGDVLNLHALLVLIVLTVAGHYFGVWGLLLSVPVAVFVIRDVIMKQGPARQAADPQAPARPGAP